MNAAICTRRGWGTKRAAKRAMKRMQPNLRGDKAKYTYRCPACARWHLSTSRTRSPIEREFTDQGRGSMSDLRGAARARLQPPRGTEAHVTPLPRPCQKSANHVLMKG